MGCSRHDLHCRVYAILNGDATLTAMTKIYNNVPQKDAVYPYTCIGRVDGNAFLTFDDNGDDMIYNVDIFGVSSSMKKIYDIAQRVKELLASKEEVISTLTCCVLMFQYAGTDEQPNKNMELEGRMLTVEFNVKVLK